MKVLLTGATGFLGKYVIDELKNNSYTLFIFIDFFLTFFLFLFAKN